MNNQGAKYKLSPKGRRKLGYPSKTLKSNVKLPLIGKTIYLDVKESKHLKQLREDLKKLGATLEDFVSRDINYLITSQPRPKKKVANACADESPTPSPFNCDPSPSPGFKEDKKVASVTRGKALLEKARYTKQASTLLDNAEKWGVKIVSIEGAIKWIEIELKKLPKSSRQTLKKNIKSKCVSSYKLLKAPYVKLETDNFCYRPFHMELDVWPRLNVDTPKGSCPFDGTLIKGGDESREERGELLAAQVDIPSEDTPQEEKDVCDSADSTTKPKSVKKSESDVGAGRILTAGELKRRKELKRKQERKRGYCECCHVKYEDLDKHVLEEQHRQYVKTKTNYNKLDSLIQSGPNTQHFLFEYLTKAAHLRNSVLDRENSVRRSPRKTVPDSNRIINSPCKPQKQSIMSSPKKCLPLKTGSSVARESVRVSPRKNQQTLKNDESVNVSKTPDVLKTKDSEIRKTPTKRHTDTGVKSPNLKIRNKEDGNGCRSPRLRQSVGIQKVNNTEMNTMKREEMNKDVSKINESNKMSSPRKSLNERFAIETKEAWENIRVSDEINKENISPCKQKLDTIEKSKKKSSNPDEKQKCVDIEEVQNIVNVSNKSPIKCAEKALKNVEECKKKMTVESVDDSDKDTLLEDLVVDDYKLIKFGFAEIVNFGKKRTAVEQSSDDFEICFARSLDGPLPMPKVSNEEALDKTFDQLCEKTQSVRKSKKANRDVDNNALSNSPRQENKKKDKCSKREITQNSTEVKVTKETEKKRERKVKDVFDIDVDSDIPSDFQCYDERGNVITFCKTLAERIKERSLGRRSSVESYNVNALFRLPSRSRSNSFSSNQSDPLTVKGQNEKLKKGIEKKKTGSSIASSKVLNKYRKKRFGKVQNENVLNGYQGDDENEKTPQLKQIKPSKKKAGNRFWHYKPIVESKKSPIRNEKLTGLRKELKELEAASSWFETDVSDSDSQRSRRNSKIRDAKLTSKMVNDEKHKSNEGKRNCSKPNQTNENLEQVQETSTGKREKGGRSNKFWYYVTEVVETNIDQNEQENEPSTKELPDDKYISTNDFNSTRKTKKTKKTKNSSEAICNVSMENNTLQGESYLPIPNELIDSWNTGELLDRSQRRKSEKTYVDTDTDYISDNDDLGEQTTKISQINVEESVNENGKCEKESRSSKSKKPSRFWEFVPVEECKTMLDSGNIPNILRDSWNTGGMLDRQERRKGRKLEISSTKSYVGREVQNRDKEINTGAEVTESGRVVKNVKSKNCTQHYILGNDNTETDQNAMEYSKKIKALKYSKDYDYNSDSSNAECRVLRLRTKKTLKSNCIDRGLRKRQVRVNYNESESQQSSEQSDDFSDMPEKQHQKMCKKHKEENINTTDKNALMQTGIKHNEIVSTKSKIEKSKHKNRVLEVPGVRACTDMTNEIPDKGTPVNVAKFLPKEVQQLQDTWNDLNIVRRSRLRRCDDDSVVINCDEKLEKCEASGEAQSECEDMMVDDSDTDNDLSNSPVFKLTINQKIQRVRRKSPVFIRSPRQVYKSDDNSSCNKKGASEILTSVYSSNVRSNNNVRRNFVDSLKAINDGNANTSKDICLDSENEIYMDKQETSIDRTNKSCGLVKTPERCQPKKESRSGFSVTPREERRRQWKRKNSESSCPEGKRRKVENCTPRRRLLQDHSEKTTVSGENENVNDKFSLTWSPINTDDKKENCEKVKLNRSWSLLSERSISKLLSSEDDNENFDGFTNEDKLPSDMSYEERSEIEFLKDDEHEWVVEDTDKKSEAENLVKYVPVFFPSPNKTSNSSWNDAVEGYIENSLKQGPNSSMKVENSSVYFSFNCSPRKTPSKQNTTNLKVGSHQICSPVRGRASTPKRKKTVPKDGVEKVDAEIEFNFGSPHKDRSDFSPLRSVNGVVRNLSCTPNKTSTPVQKKTKSRKH
ncbi:uncharacterized protein LOC132751301 isoform X2 [Ruditapes philippinarum]|uniref:uncharacterized protein LOC132751301 isoform X2 n=1 Tax=Ruditapes philippinarum TaxID=129788 RepID=UPI00295C013E|nr:uncharacterized protein LOC132751301 isoform X2 [Ruditapes philippinarum]